MSGLEAAIKADVLEAQSFSRKHLVLELDFSEASIEALESHVDTIDYAIPGGKSQENVDMLARIWGAYVGEALRIQCGGQWTRAQDGKICLRGGQAIACPQEQVRLRLTAGAGHNLADYFNRMKSQL